MRDLDGGFARPHQEVGFPVSWLGSLIDMLGPMSDRYSLGNSGLAVAEFPAALALGMSPSQITDQVGALGVDPLVDRLMGNRGQLRARAPKPACDQFGGPPVGQHLLDLMAQDPALKTSSLVAILATPLGTLVSFMGPIAFAAPVAVKLSADRAGGTSDFLGNFTQ